MISLDEKKIIVSFLLLIFLGACGNPFGSTGDAENISSPDFCPFSRNSDGSCPSSELTIDITGAYFVELVGGADFDYFETLTPLVTGGLVAVGKTASDGAGGDDGLIVKFDVLGNIVWAKTIGDTGTDILYCVTELSSGDLIVVGETDSTGSVDGIILKLDKDGNILWNKTIGGAGIEKFRFVVESPAGGLVAVGVTNDGAGAGSYDGLVVKFDTNGNVVWSNAIGGISDDRFRSITTLSGGGFLIVGQSASGVANSDGFIIKLDDNGNILWDKIYENPVGYDQFLGCIELSTGGHAISGYLSLGQYAGLLLKLDTNGNLVWDRLVDGAGADVYYKVTELSTGSIVGAGFTNSDGAGGVGYDGLAVAVDGDGSFLWGKTIGSTGDDRIFFAEESATGQLLMVGQLTDSGAGSTDGLLAQLDLTGGLGGETSSWIADTVTITSADSGLSLIDADDADTETVLGWSTQDAPGTVTISDAVDADTITELVGVGGP